MFDGNDCLLKVAVVQGVVSDFSEKVRCVSRDDFQTIHIWVVNPVHVLNHFILLQQQKFRRVFYCPQKEFIIVILTVAVANKRETVLCVINQSGCNKPGETVASGSRGWGASFK